TYVSGIIRATDDLITPIRCDENTSQNCIGGNECRIINALWEELGRYIGTYLDALSLADVLEGNFAVRDDDSCDGRSCAS
ncbi:MAG: hypothetical protein U9N14_05065, partial [Pseudomonadota bacterium]|nr:hypothetical protein [Pseudomonadota bacterium]